MFLSCGDCLFDVFAAPAKAGEVSTLLLSGRVGGSPLNVALGLARLGHPSSFFTKISDDLFGRRIRAFMDHQGIDQRFLVATDRKTTLAMVSLGADGTPRYDFYIEGTADRSIEPADLPSALPDEVRAIHVASYTTVTEPTASALDALVARESGRRFISYDPNVRASIEPNLDLWRERVARFVPAADLVKASEEDLGLLFPGVKVTTILEDWVAAGAKLAVVTRGERGAVALSRGGVFAEAPGVSVRVADTVGAGDTFQAALLAILEEQGLLSARELETLDRSRIEALLAFAIRAAAITCTRQGADLPRRADLGLPPLT